MKNNRAEMMEDSEYDIQDEWQLDRFKSRDSKKKSKKNFGSDDLQDTKFIDEKTTGKDSKVAQISIQRKLDQRVLKEKEDSSSILPYTKRTFGRSNRA